MAAPNDFPALFAMEITHQYLNGGAYGAFAMTPLGATEKLLRRLDWVGAQTGNRFAVYANLARAAAVLKAGPSPALAALDLVYALQFRDSAFAQYTDLPMRAGSVVSLADWPGGPKGERPRLTSGPSVSEDDLVFIQPGSFACPVVKPGARGGWWLAARGGEKLVQLPPPTGGAVTVDATGLASGIYQILEGERTIYTFFIKSDVFPLPSGAVLSISMGQMLTGLQRCAETPDSPRKGSAPGPLVYELALPARATFWRYDIFNHGGALPKEFDVEAGGAAAGCSIKRASRLFTRVPGVAGPGSEISIAFQSKQAFPLQARPTQRFQLLRNSRPVIDSLPTPDLAFTPAVKGNGLCSHMIVYL